MGSRRLGPYRLVAELGVGGMGTVHRAVVEDDVPGLPRGTAVAVKVIHPHLAAQPTLLARFRREAEAGSRVVDDHVVRTYRADEIAGPEGPRYVLVMQYVEGQTLRSLLQELGRVPEALCRHIGREAARGLAAIHQAGIVHRDLKPENVLITPDHRVKVMDLGVAHAAWDTAQLSQAGAFVGSLPYAAPEQVRGQDTTDGRADLYSLGVVLYELATGRHPHGGLELPAMLRSVLEGVTRRCADLCPDLSPFYDAVVHGLLATDPGKRIPAALDLARILEEGEAAPWWAARRGALDAGRGGRPRPARTPRETSMHGREADLEALRAAYERARRGAGGAVLVDGEAGIGRTRLVDEFLAWIDGEDEPARSLVGSCRAPGSGALVEAFREHFGRVGVMDRLRPCLPDGTGLVEPLAALIEGRPPPSGAPALDSGSLLSGSSLLLRGLARERTTVLALEDLHLASREERDVVTGLCAAAPGARLLLVLTSRTAPEDTWPAVLRAMPHVVARTLRRLGAKDLFGLLEEAFRSEQLAAELGSRIAAKSDGNPWFTFEILRRLREEHRIATRADGTWTTTAGLGEIDVPPTVRDAVEGRLRALDEDGREYLEMAACAGFEFDPSAVSAALGVSRLAGLRTCARLERAQGLIRGAGRRYAFDHHQVQEALYTNLHPQMREVCHLALGSAIEGEGGSGGRGGGSTGGTLTGSAGEPDGPTCVELCRHFLHGGVPHRAAPYLRPALAYLRSSCQHDAAWHLGGQALDAAGLLADAARVEVILGLAGGDDSVCPPVEAIRRLEEALTLAGRLDRPDLVASAGASLARILTRLGRWAEAEAAIPAFLEAARRAGDPAAEARLLGCLGHAADGLGRVEEARRHHEAQREHARRHGLPTLEGNALGNLSVLEFRAGNFEEALARAKEGVARYAGGGTRLGTARIRCAAADAALFLGRLDEAYALYEEAIAEFRALGQRWDEAITLSFHAWLLSHLGEHERALECVRRGLEIAAFPDARELTAPLLMREAEIRLLQGDLDRAAGLATDAMAAMATSPRPDDLVWPLTLLGQVEQSRGRPAAARERYLDAIARHPAPERSSLRVPLACFAACVGGVDPREAAALLREHGHRLARGDHMTASLALWRATGDGAHLRAARADLDFWVAHAPPAYREALLTRIPLHVEIRSASSAGTTTPTVPGTVG